MDNKVGITLEDLKALSEVALSRGTEVAWMRMAIEFAEQAVKEVARLREELAKYNNEQD